MLRPNGDGNVDGDETIGPGFFFTISYRKEHPECQRTNMF